MHEAISGGSAKDVASAFIPFFRSLGDVKDVLLWLDNCSILGKNWWIYAALVAEVNKCNRNLNSITLKYFKPGHTFISANSFHHQDGLAIKRKGCLDNFTHFVVAVKSKGEALVLKHGDFFTMPRGVSQEQYAKVKIKLEDIHIVNFV